MRVSGVVVDESSAKGLPGLRILLSPPSAPSNPPSSDSRPVPAQTRTNGDGRFELELPADRWLPSEFCRILIGDDEEPLFRGSVPAVEDLLLVARTPDVLRGRLLAREALPYAGVGVVAYTPLGTGGMAAAVYCGRSKLDGEGRFEFRVRPSVRAESYLLRFQGPVGFAFETEVPRAELVSPEGAEIRTRMATLCLFVRDQQTRPLEGAEVRTTLPSCPEAHPAALESDREGRAEAWLPLGAVRYCVGKEGFAPASGEVDLAEEGARVERSVFLRGLVEEDAIGGEVLDPDGKELPDAVVSVKPVGLEGDVIVPMIRTTRTDVRGRFRLPYPFGERVSVAAYHRRYGSTPRFEIVVDNRFFQLRFEAVGEIVIVPRMPSEKVAMGEGAVQYLLLDRDFDRTFSGHVWGFPLEIDEVPPGAFNLFVLWRGPDLYGQTSVSVSAGERREIELPMASASWLGARAVDAEGNGLAGLEVRVDHPDWPRELDAAWGAARTGSDGRVRVLAGALDRAEVIFLRGGDVAARRWLDAGHESRVTVPEPGDGR